MTVRTNIHMRPLEEGEGTHSADEHCWCRPAVTAVHSHGQEPHLVIDHHAGVSQAVLDAMNHELNADLRPTTPARVTPGHPLPL